MNKEEETILEVAYCIEKQFEADTRLLLSVCGMWSLNGERAPYFRWVEELIDKSKVFCIRENLIRPNEPK